MTTENFGTTGEAAIKELIDRAGVAIHAKDVEGSVAYFAADVVSFDFIDPLQFEGIDSVRERLES